MLRCLEAEQGHVCRWYHGVYGQTGRHTHKYVRLRLALKLTENNLDAVKCIKSVPHYLSSWWVPLAVPTGGSKREYVEVCTKNDAYKRSL